MKNILAWLGAFALTCLSSTIFARDITGVWQQIDDQTVASKALIEINKESNGTYSGTITKITPRIGYPPKEFCVNCPAPYTNKPILGMKIITNLKAINEYEYENGNIIDPTIGRIYKSKIKMSKNGTKMTLRGYYGFSMIGRSQTWIRINPTQPPQSN